MADELDELLERAALAYVKGGSAYRDSLVEAGRLLHEFLRAGLARWDGVRREARCAAGVTRGKLVRRAAGRLGVSYARVLWLVKAAMTADLLGDGGLGGMPHCTLGALGALVERCTGKGGLSAGDHGGPPVSEAERWRILPGLEERARALFRRAAEEGWPFRRARPEVLALLGGRRTWRSRIISPALRKQRAEAAEVLRRQARAGTPADVAEMLWEVIKDAPDPLAVVHRLRALALAPRGPNLYEQAAV